VAYAVHQHQLDRFAYASYQGGFLCQTIAGAALTSDALLPLVPSLAALVDQPSPVEVGLRPQAPPSIALAGTAEAPLFDVTFEGLEVDVMADIEQQPVRLFTVVADAHAIVALGVDGDGAIVPDVSELELTAVTIEGVQGVTEQPEAIAGLVTPLVEDALGTLLDVGPVALPPLAGVPVEASEVGRDGDFLTVGGQLAPQAQLGWFVLLLLLALAGAAPACGGGDDDDGEESPCGESECEPGQVEHGPVGRWSSIASGDGRTVVATYDSGLGDLVAVEIDGEDRAYTAVDGIPDQAPVHDGGYRGGVEGAGPDRGAWTSIALDGGLAIVAYQDRDAGDLLAARETAGGWVTGVVDTGGDDQAGVQASIAVLGDGTAAIAYVVSGADRAQLRLARADGDDWEVATLATVDLVQGVETPDLAALEDDRLAVVYRDRERRALVLLVESAAGSGDFAETVLDGGGEADRGRWCTVVADGDTLHIAYQDLRADDLYYISWEGAPGAIERIDSGARDGDRPHAVGAGASIYMHGDSVRVAYQDGHTADVVIATRGPSVWAIEPLTSGALLDGFHLDAASPGVIVWDWVRADDATAPHNLQVRTP
jgi:hypothetical protein